MKKSTVTFKNSPNSNQSKHLILKKIPHFFLVLFYVLVLNSFSAAQCDWDKKLRDRTEGIQDPNSSKGKDYLFYTDSCFSSLDSAGNQIWQSFLICRVYLDGGHYKADWTTNHQYDNEYKLDMTLYQRGFYYTIETSSPALSQNIVSVKITDTINNCDTTLRIAFTPIGCSSLSVSQMERGQNDLRVFPNPSSEIINLDILASKVQALEVYGSDGKRVAVYSNINRIDISSFAQGVYHLRLVATDGKLYRKSLRKI
jgi:hypothetical protein